MTAARGRTRPAARHPAGGESIADDEAGAGRRITAESMLRALAIPTHGELFDTAWVDALMIGTVHCGAHIDALSHVTRGDADERYNGYAAQNHPGSQGGHHIKSVTTAQRRSV